MLNQPKIDTAKVAEVNILINQVAPTLHKIVGILRAGGMHEIEMEVSGEKFYWSDLKIKVESPTQAQLTDELTAILDQQYSPIFSGGFTFMNMIWNPNRAVAEKMAAVIADFRRRDRAQVESQIIALLTAFKQGS